MTIKRRDKTTIIVGTALFLQKWGIGFQNTNNETLLGCYPEFWEGEVLKKNRKNNVNESSLSQYVMCFPNAAVIHGALQGPGGVSPLMRSRNEILKAPVILRHLKPENSSFWTVLYLGNTLK